MNIKLTDKNHKTRAGHVNETYWEIGKPIYAASKDPDLCSSGWIHFYRDPLIAFVTNPVHADIKDPIGWEFVPIGEEKHEPLKSGARGGMIIKQIELPVVSAVNCAAFGILSALEVHKEPKFAAWAEDWLSGKDRTAAPYAAHFAASAAHFAAYAAYYAAYAAPAAHFAAARCAAYAAYYASYYAASAAASRTNNQIDFIALAHKAMEIK